MDDEGLLIEVDRGLAAAKVIALPSTDDDELVTESSNPYLQLTFSETSENTAEISFPDMTEDDLTTEDVDESEDNTVNASFASVKDGSDTVALDAHKKVTLTAVTLDGEDVSGQVGPGMSTTNNRFTIALRRPRGR